MFRAFVARIFNVPPPAMAVQSIPHQVVTNWRNSPAIAKIGEQSLNSRSITICAETSLLYSVRTASTTSST